MEYELKNACDVADEILKQRDAHLKRRKRRLRNTVTAVLTVVIVVSATVGTFFIAAGLSESPNVPSVETVTDSKETTVDTEPAVEETKAAEETVESTEPETETETETAVPTEEPTVEATEVPTEEPSESTVVDTEHITPDVESIMEKILNPESDDPSGTDTSSPDSVSGIADIPYKKDIPGVPQRCYFNAQDSLTYIDADTILPDTVSLYQAKEGAHLMSVYKQEQEYLLSYVNSASGGDYTPGWNEYWVYDGLDSAYIRGYYMTDSERGDYESRTIQMETHTIKVPFSISKVEGYRDMTAAEVIEWLNSFTYFTSAVELLGLQDYVIEARRFEDDRNNSYIYYIYVNEKNDIVGAYEAAHSKGCIVGYIRFRPNYESNLPDYMGDLSITGSLQIYCPNTPEITDTYERIPYGVALEMVFSQYDFGEYEEYFRDNIKCTASYDFKFIGSSQVCNYPNYSFYIESLDENGDTVYYLLDEVPMYSQE